MDPSQLPPQIANLPAFSIQVTVHIKPECLEEFLKIIRSVHEIMAKEPNCLYFEVFQDPMDEGTISWIENWNKDVAWLLSALVANEDMKRCFEAVEHTFAKPREFKILKRLEGLVTAKEGNFEGAMAGKFRE